MAQFDVTEVRTADADLMRAIGEKMDLLDDEEQRRREELAPRPGRDVQCALLAVVARTTWPGITAEDATQESLLVAFERLPTLREPERFSSWLVGIAKRISMNLVSRSGEAACPEQSYERTTADALTHLTAKELRLQVWTELENLTPEVREALVLYYFEGESVRRMAATLDITRNAAKCRLKRGREVLRERLWLTCGDTIGRKLNLRKRWCYFGVGYLPGSTRKMVNFTFGL